MKRLVFLGSVLGTASTVERVQRAFLHVTGVMGGPGSRRPGSQTRLRPIFDIRVSDFAAQAKYLIEFGIILERSRNSIDPICLRL